MLKANFRVVDSSCTFSGTSSACFALTIEKRREREREEEERRKREGREERGEREGRERRKRGRKRESVSSLLLSTWTMPLA